MSQLKQRDYFWDNIKALLIFFVVAGHCLEMSSLHTKLSVGADTLIYSFHMPAFMFVSGFFLKRYCTDGKVRAQKAAVIFAYYIIAQLLFVLLRTLVGIPFKRLTLFTPCRGLWYLLALFFFYLLIPIIEKLPAWFVIPFSIGLALIVANDREAKTYFTILRAFSFAPYCFAGYYLSGNAIKKLRSLKAYIRFPAAIVCAAVSVSLWFFDRDHPWNKMFYAKMNNPTLKIKENMDAGVATMLRLEVYLMAFLMIAALLLVIPSKKTIFSKIGQNSLQIYILHMAVIVLVRDSGLWQIDINRDWIFAVLMLGAAAVTYILSLGIFSYPFKWIQTGVEKLYSIKDKERVRT